MARLQTLRESEQASFALHRDESEWMHWMAQACRPLASRRPAASCPIPDWCRPRCTWTSIVPPARRATCSCSGGSSWTTTLPWRPSPASRERSLTSEVSASWDSSLRGPSWLSRKPSLSIQFISRLEIIGQATLLAGTSNHRFSSFFPFETKKTTSVVEERDGVLKSAND